MTRPIAAAATLLLSFSLAASAFAQYPPQQYPPQQYPPQQYPPQQYPPQQQPPQQYPPQQGYPQQYPQQQPYQQPMAPVQQSYGPPVAPAAPGFGSAGQVIFSADRLFGLSFWSTKFELDNDVTVSASNTSINLLWGSGVQSGVDVGGNFTAVSNPYSIPRLGVDFTVVNNFSVGGSIALVTRSGTAERSSPGMTTSLDTPSLTSFAFAPRVGYILALNPMIGFWFKAGITYFSSKGSFTSTTPGVSSTTFTSTSSGFSVNLEPELVVTPVPHFGLTVGPVADIPLTGNDHEEQSGAMSQSKDYNNKTSNYGLIIGLLGYM